MNVTGIEEIDEAIGAANKYYLQKYKYAGFKTPISLYWTPTYMAPHLDPLSGYFIVWVADERTFDHEYRGDRVSYFFFKGQLEPWKRHYSTPEQYDVIEKWLFDRNAAECVADKSTG